LASREPSASRGGGRSARRRARELALQGVYQWLVGGQDAAAIEGQLADTEAREGVEELGRKTDLVHYRELLHGAIDGADELRRDFAPYLDRAVDALSPIEHGILLIGTYEMKRRQEIP
jgi:N utilization substance protein B